MKWTYEGTVRGSERQPREESRLVRKLWSEDTVGCPRCNLMPVQYRAGLVKADGSWTTGKLWFQCPGCGMRGRKAESHDESARLWNERVSDERERANGGRMQEAAARCGADYRRARQERGTQKGVALALGVDYRTVQRREAGEIEITREAALALLALPKTKARRRAR